MDVGMGLLAALLWGGTDLLMGINARAVGVKRAVFFGQAIGLTIMSVMLVIFPALFTKALSASWEIWGLGIAASLLMVFGTLALSKALMLGKTAIIAPLATSYGVVTTLLSWVSGEHIGIIQLLCIVLCVLGVLLSSTPSGSDTSRSKNTSISVIYAILAAIFYGTTFWLQGHFVLPHLGPVGSLWLGYLLGVNLLFFVTFRVKDGLALPTFRSCAILTATSMINFGAFSAFAWGTSVGSVSVVTVLSTLSGGIAAILACVFFRERISKTQVMGVVLVLFGAVILKTIA